MTRNRVLAGLAVVLVLAVGLWLLRGAQASEASPYRLAELEQGDLEATVTATGALSAVTTVQVGTQVSGKVTELRADFNDRVKRGQLIARIDPTLLRQAVLDASASMERGRAELERAEREYERKRTLFERKVLTESEFNSAQYELAVARANLKSAQVSLDRARQNLAYTEIYAPIDGIVVERNVEPGQTVAASLSAPQLFLIANDLARMQILAAVDEADIGKIHEGQAARFTVQAYPDQSFTGTVQQVRLQSTTQENVVNYTVVVGVENPEGRLLPGMTASVDFLVETAADVLLVPNAALRFRPTEEMLAQVREARGGEAAAQAAPAGGPAAARGGERARAGREAGAQTWRQGGAPGGPAGGGRPGGAAGVRRPGDLARLWYLDESGKPAVLRVRTGITDGRKTVVQGEGLRPGMQIITGVNDAGAEAGATNPFQQQRQPQGGPPRPGGF